MATIFFLCQPIFSSRGSSFKKKRLQQNHHYYCHAKTVSSGSPNFEHNLTSSFNFKNRVGVPLNELASFDEYMEDKGRVLQVIFPEKSTSQQINEEEWKVKMSPMQALFLTCHPVIHITARCISAAEDYPPGHITKLLEILITRCELEGLQADYMPLGLTINAKGALYLEKEERQNWMKSQLHITLSYVVPPLLAWVPEQVMESLLKSVLRNYAEDINNGLAMRLSADYNSFKRSVSKKSM